MRNTEITLRVNHYRLNALSETLANRGSTLEQELLNAFSSLYEKLVPQAQREDIERKIADSENQEELRQQMLRRFGMFHVRENGEDSYFTCDAVPRSMQAAKHYRQYSLDELPDVYQSFVESFGEIERISQEQFEQYVNDRYLEPRISTVVEFDMDEKTATVIDRECYCHAYTLAQYSIAAGKAYANENKTDGQRSNIFVRTLDGKELDVYPFQSPSPTPKLNM